MADSPLPGGSGPRQAMISLRLSATQAAQLRARAGKQGVSAFIRGRLFPLPVAYTLGTVNSAVQKDGDEDAQTTHLNIHSVAADLSWRQRFKRWWNG